MTDRIHALTVHLNRDYRDDDAASLIDAIMHLRGVVSVETHITGPMDHMARARVRAELEMKAHDAITELFRTG